MNEVLFFLGLFCRFTFVVGGIDVDYKRKEERVSDMVNCNYRQQIGEKFRLDKACGYKKKSR